REAIERGITEAMSGMEGGIDPSNPESIQQLLSSGVLEPEETPEQQMALRRLETLLALVEGWVDVVVADAVGERLPGADALRETLRRRRASGGPAEQTFATLVGLELRPRKLRAASELWRKLTEQHGIEDRDALWGHPDLLPTAEDLDDPTRFVDRAASQAAELEDPIAALERTAAAGAPREQSPDDSQAPGSETTDPKAISPEALGPEPPDDQPQRPPE
ncbi:MAG: zinc-dependent metalloprotease, partial [Actinomycetota bacterium]|nr:zinc-dependent metalloprotease [Actinomycetota bacterium]